MAEPEITRLTREFNKQLEAGDAEVSDVMARNWLEVETRLEQDILTLATQAANDAAAGKIISVATLGRMERYLRLMAQVQAEIERFNGQATVDIDQLQKNAARLGFQSAVDLISATTGSQANEIIGTFDRLGSEAVQNVIAISRAGGPLSNILNRSYPLTATAMTDRLLYGTAMGWNPRKTARSMIKDGLSQALQHTLLVARDQQIRSFREASRQQYEASKVVKLYMRMAALQTRTCLACLALDGSIYKTSELIPLHPQDRCSMIPLVDGFPKPSIKTGAEWFNEQPAAVQRQMMGPGKYTAWKDGKFEFSQLATIRDNKTWGPGAQVTSLKNLLIGKGGPPNQKKNFTPEYWETKEAIDRILIDGEFYDGELQETKDQLLSEQIASDWARRYDFVPGKMSQSEWKKLANQLKADALDDLRLASEEDRIAAGNLAVNRKFVGPGSGKYIQLGGQSVELQWTGGSRAAAEQAIRSINAATKRQANEWMTGKLSEFGYTESSVSNLSYEQKRRLLAEIGNGELQTQNIAGVSRDERQQILNSLSPKQMLDARSVAMNPRAGGGLDKWTGYELAMIKSGNADEIIILPDFAESSLPDYVLGRKKPKKTEVRPVIKPVEETTEEFDF